LLKPHRLFASFIRASLDNRHHRLNVAAESRAANPAD
jgi:hypothetical protein